MENEKTVFPQCPRCESKKVVIRSKLYFAFLFFIMSGCVGFVGLFFFPFLFLGAIGMLFSPLVALFIPKRQQCLSCNYAWNFKEVK